MSQTAGVVPTETVTATTSNADAPELVLRLSKKADDSAAHVTWTTDTVDNEGMGKSKSKCCCIYKKPKSWQDSSSDSDSDCETGHCRGHVEEKKKKQAKGCGDNCSC